MIYSAVFSEKFRKQLSKLKKKDKKLYDRLERKIREILQNPIHKKHLRNILKGQQRVQLGSFVLRFEVETNEIYFINLTHHDDAY